ncbi:MAG TPA: cytochrome c peroxidase [Pseudomonadales bacterium]
MNARIKEFGSTLALCVTLCAGAFSIDRAAKAAEGIDASRQAQLEDLGRALFFDVNLSQSRTQSCATCHDPALAFIDWRAFVPGDAPAEASVGAALRAATAGGSTRHFPGAASLGGDSHSLGDRNAPTASYAAHIPPLTLNADGDYVGGLFWDGRADTLEDQAAGPVLNMVEMAMVDKGTVLARLSENPNYGYAFKGLFGDDVLDDEDTAYAALTQAIAAFERTEFFSPFDSKYDRYLRGEYEPTEQETLGMTLFFSNQFANCNQCHQLQPRPEMESETFTSYKYRNIGVPVNHALRAANGLGPDHVDRGLRDNPEITDDAQSGRFRVPTLRNVALTGPYMHNGVFNDLRTVVLFYNKYLARGSKAQTNPETGENWGPPEVPENLALDELESGRALGDKEIDGLVAFMRMLTDQRYERLLPAQSD